ncbi:hypothetical protein Tco_0111835 [Tanacetum coccineum]
MLVGYTDSDLAGNKDNMKSTSRYLMTFAGGAVSWQSRLQKCVALSTTEAEYMAATEACKELLWLKRFLQELGFKQQRYAVLCDNQSAIHLAKNSMFHKRTKHIDIRYHWIRDAIEDGMFELNKVHTDDNASDMLTKAVAREKLKVDVGVDCLGHERGFTPLTDSHGSPLSGSDLQMRLGSSSCRCGLALVMGRGPFGHGLALVLGGC